MSDLANKLKQQRAEQAAKQAAHQSKPPVDNQMDDEVIDASKKGKVAGKGDVAAALSHSTPPVPVTPPAEPTEHTVVSGDNLSMIAKKYYGDANRWQEIYEANKTTIGANPSAIRAGMVLKIPR